MDTTIPVERITTTGDPGPSDYDALRDEMRNPCHAYGIGMDELHYLDRVIPEEACATAWHPEKGGDPAYLILPWALAVRLLNHLGIAPESVRE